MRIAVECGGFDDAADACHTANHIAALVTESLAGKLGSYAGMAGDDATSSEFATSYDAGAREALATLAELTHAFTGLGRLLRTTGANHAAAETASAGRDSGADVGGGRHEAWRRVAPAPPPSSLGSDEPSLGAVDAWILDHVEGFVWPGADVSLLRDAALTWQRAAASVERLTAHLDVVEPLLGRQHSPEIPVALEVVASLRALVVTVADDLAALGRACDDYADAVAEAHDRTRALLAEVGQMIVEGVFVSVIVGGITGGLGAGASAGATITRIRAHAPRFHALLLSVRATASSGATRVRAAGESLVRTRDRLEKFARVPVRDERGSAVNPFGVLLGRDRAPGWLRQHEVPPGHAVRDHVGKSVDEMMERCKTLNYKQSSSFPSERVAERAIADVLDARRAEIEQWLRSGTRRSLPLQVDLAKPTGITVSVEGRVLDRTGARVVLIPKDDMPEGFQILTAFPA